MTDPDEERIDWSNFGRYVAMHEEKPGGHIEDELHDGSDPDLWLGGVDLGVQFPDREHRLYVRYVRALALLCECAPYVDDEDYLALIDELLADACKHYPLVTHQDGEYRGIAPRMPATK